MRIGIDATSWTNGRGFGRFVRELLSAIARLETEDAFVLLTDRQSSQQADFPKDWRVLVGETSVSPAQAASAQGRRSIPDMLAMRRLTKREPFDLIFFPAVYSYFPVGRRTPCLVTFHDVIAETLPHLVFQSRRSRFFWNLKCRLAVARCSRVVTVSQASKRGLMKTFRLEQDQVRVISEAPSEAFGPVDRSDKKHAAVLTRYDLQPGERFLLSVGGISPHKNLDSLIAAHARLVAEPAFGDVLLLLVGDYQGDVFRTCHAELMRQISGLGTESLVRFPGYVPDADLAHLYAASVAFVFPSFLEGFGLPAVEAMACGAVVVASDRGSLPEVLDGAGILFDPYDVSSLVAALRRVVSDAAYQADLRARSEQRARAFSWELSARQAVDIFHEFAR